MRFRPFGRLEGRMKYQDVSYLLSWRQIQRKRKTFLRGPEPRVSLIRVHLQRGGGAVVSVDLTEQQLEAEAPLGAPLRDYVLGKADPGLFRYQVLTVRGGMRTPVTAWKEASTNLIITTEDLE